MILEVDNIACYYAWDNKYVKNDICSSILIRALCIISSYLRTYVHVRHLPRLSSWEACMCDRMSRESTTSKHDRKLLNHFSNLFLPDVLLKWLENPVEDWSICLKLLDSVKDQMK